jgi:hypothetical protein
MKLTVDEGRLADLVLFDRWPSLVHQCVNRPSSIANITP